MALIDLSKDELCLISIALNAYQMDTDNYHLDEMKKISTRIDNTYKMCTCKENVSEWTLLLISDWPTTPMKLLSGMIVTPKPQGVKQICDNLKSYTIWLDYGLKSIIISTYTTKHMKTDPNKDFTIKEFYIKVKGDYGKEKNVRVNDLGDKLITLITDLGWEYQRMGRSGREVYDEIQQLLGTIPENEVYMEI